MYTPVINPAVVEAVRLAFQRSKNTPRYWRTRQTTGRLDSRTVWRNVATGRTDVFKDRLDPGATRVNVHILVDGSGSMGGASYATDGTRKPRIERAADIAATLTEAFHNQTQVNLNVWMHNTMSGMGGVAIFPVVTNGKGRDQIGLMPAARGGGNGDGYAIQWVNERIKRERRRGEVSLIIVINDGLPSWLATWVYSGNAVQHVNNVVEEVRDSGTMVVSVAIDSLGASQHEMYGDDVIPFEGDWNALAATFGTIFGSVLARAIKGRR